ncbi:NADH-quinone oxidoreductase subunit L [Bacteroidota bacterium]
MSELTIINLSLMTLILPLIGFIVVLLLGKRYQILYLFEVGILIISLFLSMVLLFGKIVYFVDKDIIFAFNWFEAGSIPLIGAINVELGIKIDNITAIMILTVNIVSCFVHIYSIAYMKGDKRYTRYFAYLGIFTFSMIGIVITHNLLMMYIFWELVGLSSYLLIGFWYEKKSAADAGKKAFIVNRIGDIGMFIGILILFTQYKTFTFDKIFEQISLGNLPFDSTAWLTAAGILVFLGAVGKSAQFPLHVWLPDAMEGPTPVSALIHAATMVAAGVYLSVRIFVMLTADAMLFIAIVGAITAFISATIALTQNDIKKVLAYSTVSQLGYMVMSVGVGAYAFAFFHLVTHAMFKAGLFLGSGSVIHAMHHEQDIQNMGGLKKKLPYTYYTFLVASFALCGIPFTSGFLSKDGILASSLAFGNLTGGWNWLIPIAGFTVAAMTAFYMFRLIILTFHGEPRNKEKYDHAHESPFVMVMPLVVLSTLSIFIWFTPNPFSSDAGWFMGDWVQTPASVVPQESRFEFMQTDAANPVSSEIVHSEIYEHAMHWAHYPAMILSILMAGFGIFLAFFIYQWKKVNADKLAGMLKPLYKFSLNKWYFDELYHATAVAGTLGVAKIFTWFDNNVVDGIVNGSAWVTKQFSKMNGWFDDNVVDWMVNFTAFVSGFIGLSFRRLQTGKVQTYIVFAVFSVIILLLLF